MLEIIFLVPFFAGLAVFFLPRTAGRWLMVLTGIIHLLLTVGLWVNPPAAMFQGYFGVWPEGLLSLSIISLLFVLISSYTVEYLKQARMQHENIFTGSLLLFLSTMTMVALADHIMVMWIAIEATTLTSAPLIFIHRTPKALEATWKYLLICSVGIAMALLGSVLITLAMDVGHVNAPVSFSALAGVAGQLDPVWLKAAFVFIFVGYGTKMGLAPMHTWLPDAHSEAPSPASAMLSGVLLNCAFLGIFKTNKIMVAAGQGEFSGMILMVFGLLSILAAATYIIKQTEYKRMLAYSSIENMGIIAFGTGIGGIGAYGAILCLIHHSLIKSSLFLTSGNINAGYKTWLIDSVGDLAGRMPKTFVAFFAGSAGIAGFPPFGMFIGELLIIVGAFRAGHYTLAAIFMVSLCFIFAGFSNQILKMSFGDPAENLPDAVPEKVGLVWPQYVLLLTSPALCVWMPDIFYHTIIEATVAMGGGF
ncbi:proton-conducting transporter membrane subunit [Desulfococcus sp.]|uniref:proton-conducting transporter transmembrane domain-containing protein n=1 Tax=Desulfococcus sp. TaxID=2025834 RepID=UPI0035932B3D